MAQVSRCSLARRENAAFLISARVLHTAARMQLAFLLLVSAPALSSAPIALARPAIIVGEGEDPDMRPVQQTALASLHKGGVGTLIAGSIVMGVGVAVLLVSAIYTLLDFAVYSFVNAVSSRPLYDPAPDPYSAPVLPFVAGGLTVAAGSIPVAIGAALLGVEHSKRKGLAFSF
jgi:hypothetical protein